MNRHAQKRLTDATIAILEGLLATEGREVPGGVEIVVPYRVRDNIRALAYDATRHTARKAKLDQAVTAS